MIDLATIADGRHAAALERGRAFMAEHESIQHAGPDAGAHSYRIATSYPFTRLAASVGAFASVRFRAVCACGWESDPMPTAGMAHAAHDAHATPTDTDN